MQSRLLLGILVAIISGSGTPQARGQTYKSHIEHPIVRYKLSAKLDPAAKRIIGHYHLTWWNHTEDTIPDLYFHLYLNAFKNMDSTWLRESAVSRRAQLLESWTAKPEEMKWGWVEVDKLQVSGIFVARATALINGVWVAVDRLPVAGGADLTKAITFVHPDDDNALDQTVMRVVLPRPIPPHATIELDVDFTSKLPRALARTGFKDDYFLIAQWFPKIGVYEGPGDRGRKQGGWNCRQFHAYTEFYADYGSWDVELTAPTNFVLGATGFLRSQRQNSDGTTTYNYYQDDVHDFAWTAYPHFHKLKRTFDWGQELRGDEVVAWTKILDLPAEQIALRNVDVTLLLQPDHANLADRYFRAAFNGLKYFGLWYGQYPYDTLTVVDPVRGSNSGGMEYPTFITGGAYFLAGEHSLSPEGVTVHEFGHQFWYGLVGNNEFEEAFLDEGFNTYSTGKIIELAYPGSCGYDYVAGIPVPAWSWLQVRLPPFPFAGVGGIPVGPFFSCEPFSERTAGRSFYIQNVKNDDLARFGWQYLNGGSYGLNSYTRTGLTLRTLESYLGPRIMARVMRTYHQRWRYRHPTLRDFMDTVNEVSGQNMDWFFQQFFYSSNQADYAVTDVNSEPIEGKVGVYGLDGNRTTFLSKDAAKASAASKDKRYRSTVIVRRLGEAQAPVDVLIRFDNGEMVHEKWDGQYRWVKYVYERASRVKSAEVDPWRKLVLDANFTNNSYAVKEDNRGAAKWYVRWIFWVENLMFAAGFFS